MAELEGATPTRRAALLAEAGMWYDALEAVGASGVEMSSPAFSGLVEQVGLELAEASD